MTLMRGIALGVIVMAATARGAAALLLPINFEQFSHHANCGLLVEVEAVENLTDADLLALKIPNSEREGLNRRARIRVLRWIVKGECAGVGDPILLFSTEVHSSRPEVGRQYVLLPRRSGEAWTEVVYGRSLWQTTPQDEVLVIWRNDFLLDPLDLNSGEIAVVPLATIERLLVETLAASRR